LRDGLNQSALATNPILAIQTRFPAKDLDEHEQRLARNPVLIPGPKTGLNRVHFEEENLLRIVRYLRDGDLDKRSVG